MIDRLGAHPVPIQLPIGAEGGFRGIVDLINMKAITYRDDLGKEVVVEDIPADLADAAEAARERLLDELSHDDDEPVEIASGGLVSVAIHSHDAAVGTEEAWVTKISGPGHVPPVLNDLAIKASLAGVGALAGQAMYRPAIGRACSVVLPRGGGLTGN
jgi:hypothetical protein